MAINKSFVGGQRSEVSTVKNTGTMCCYYCITQPCSDFSLTRAGCLVYGTHHCENNFATKLQKLEYDGYVEGGMLVRI